jgi:hypothetical protein
MYDIIFEVKYNSIENELLQKIKNGEKEYSIEDVLDICGELYCYEFLSVFKCDTFEDKKINDIMKDLWEKFKNEHTILIMMDKMKHKNYYHMDIDKYILFTSLFSFDTFYIIHFYIRDFLNGNLDEKKREKYIKEIESKLK